ncbi:MAG: hypothetical protein ABI867_28285 [Kofleriaceae bacterium]
MRFGPWYPLADAGDHAPASEGVLQLKLASGLIDYPRGKSAMVHYAHTPNVRAAALALANQARDPEVDRLRIAFGAATRPAFAGLVCRHLIELDPVIDLAAFYAKLEAEFVRRFGTSPHP